MYAKVNLMNTNRAGVTPDLYSFNFFKDHSIPLEFLKSVEHTFGTATYSKCKITTVQTHANMKCMKKSGFLIDYNHAKNLNLLYKGNEVLSFLCFLYIHKKLPKV